MAHDVISTCPVCSGELAVTRLRCGSCGTTLEGELGISYPTVRTRVEALVRALGFGPRSDDESVADDAVPAADAPTRESILERLARREITAEDAATAIRALGRSTR